MKHQFNQEGLCKAHGLAPDPEGKCRACSQDVPASKPEPLRGISAAWARTTALRMRPGGDLYRKP